MVLNSKICKNYDGISHKIKFLVGISSMIPSVIDEFFLPESSQIQWGFKIVFLINTYIIALSGYLCYNMVATALNRKCDSLISSIWKNDNDTNYEECLILINEYKLMQESTEYYLFLTVIFYGMTFIFDTFYFLVAILDYENLLSTFFLIGYIVYDSILLFSITFLASESYETMKNLELKLRYQSKV